MNLPLFCAVKITRLPPVDAKHCQLQSFRQEVRTIGNMKSEVDQLRQQVDSPKHTIMMLSIGSPKPDNNFQNRFSVLEAVKTGFPVLVRFWHFFLYKGVITRT